MSKEALDIVQLVAHIVAILGLPAALISYWIQTQRQQRDQELGTYNSLDEKYIEYLKLCMAHPELDLFHIPKIGKRKFNEDETIQRCAMFEILLSIFERAFLLYRDHRSDSRRRQWTGWEDYIEQWMSHPDFDSLWDKLGSQFESSFVDYIEELRRTRATLAA